MYKYAVYVVEKMEGVSWEDRYTMRSKTSPTDMDKVMEEAKKTFYDFDVVTVIPIQSGTLQYLNQWLMENLWKIY